MKKKYNFFNSREFENLIPYLVMIAVGVAMYYIIWVCVNLM
jgi:hypothetical protein